MSDIVLVPPLSKSDAQRSLVLARACGVPEARVLPPDEALPNDVQVLRDGLRALGEGGQQAVDCRDGGAPFRFLLTQAALTPGLRVDFTGAARLGERPHGALLASLREALGPLGLRLTEGAPWPLRVESPAEPLQVTRFRVAGADSSQFASSLLLGAAKVVAQGRHGCAVEVRGKLASPGYLELTRWWLERAGFTVAARWNELAVEAHRPPAVWPMVPGDWSSLTYLLPIAWKTGAFVSRVDLNALHPDRQVTKYLYTLILQMQGDRAYEVHGKLPASLDVDASACPDAVPALVACACVLRGASTFAKTSVLRLKESDRVQGLMDLVRQAGAGAELDGDTLHVRPAPLHDFSFDARDDHRLAMAAATLSCLGEVRLAIRGGASVAKSFPGFWAEVAKVGLVPRSLE